MSTCTCAHIEGYRIRNDSCPRHREADSAVRASGVAKAAAAAATEDQEHLACAWSDYRKDYGVGSDPMAAAHAAFRAGWKAAREGDQSSVLS